jgi:hypothetical protein
MRFVEEHHAQQSDGKLKADRAAQTLNQHGTVQNRHSHEQQHTVKQRTCAASSRTTG